MIKYKCRTRKRLIENTTLLPDSKFNRLKNTIYYTFREEILPYLPVKMFSDSFNSEYGRPTKDLQSMLGLFLLQTLNDMTDAEAIEAFMFHDTFRYALDISNGEILAEKTYYNYRKKLLEKGEDVFDAILKRIEERIKFNASIQRKDSTLVRTWLKRMSKLQLFTATITKFLKQLQKGHPIICSRLPESIKTKYLADDETTTWFADNKPSQYQACLLEAAKDAIDLEQRFKDHNTVSKMEQYVLLARLIQEQVQIEDGQVTLKLNKEYKEYKGCALVNPHDPDARYDGCRKDVGYHVQLTETCGQSTDDPNPKIITEVVVNKANTSDTSTVVSGVENLEAKGLKPEILLTDNGYESDDNHQSLAKKDVSHIAPPSGKLPDGFGLLDFTLDESGRTVQKCPMNQVSVENRVNADRESTVTYFAHQTCSDCPHSHDCPIKITRRKAKLAWRWKQPRLEAKRRAFAEDESIKHLFRQRSGGEAPFSILKGKMGLERTRRRGFAQNSLLIYFAATSLNILRTHRWLLLKMKEALSKNKNYPLRTFWTQLCRIWHPPLVANRNRSGNMLPTWGMAA